MGNKQYFFSFEIYERSGQIKNTISGLKNCLSSCYLVECNIVLTGKYPNKKIKEVSHKGIKDILKKNNQKSKLLTTYFKSWAA